MSIRNILVVLFAASHCPLHCPADDPPKQTVLKIAHETTRLIEPLDEAGFVDYVAAIDRRASTGVTSENNFEVVMRQLLGPEEIFDVIRKRYHDRLGIAVPSGPFYAGFPGKKQDDQYDRAYGGAWQAADHPDLARWLATVDASLDTAAKGSRRTRYYTPYITVEPAADEERYPRMISLLLPSVGGQREIARGLNLRANFRTGAGNLDAAWEDVLAIFRISRLTSQGTTLIENLVGIAIDGVAFGAAKTVLQSPALTQGQAKRFLTDLRRLPHLPSMAERIDVAERFMGLDTVQFLARENDLLRSLKMISDLSMIGPSPLQLMQPNGTRLVLFEQPEKPKPAPDVAEMPINWNIVATEMNRWYDRTVAAANENDFNKRRKLFDQLKNDLEKIGAKLRNQLDIDLFKNKTSDQNGKLLADVLVALLIPAYDAATAAQFDAIARLELLRIGFAAEVYAREYGRYPEQLSKLAPDYLDKIPGDPFSGSGFRVGASDRILLIYSVGRNGKDDRGRGSDERGQREFANWDDIVIRIRQQ